MMDLFRLWMLGKILQSSIVLSILECHIPRLSKCLLEKGRTRCRENPRLSLDYEYFLIMELACTIGEVFKDLGKTEIVEVMADKGLDDYDFFNIVNETKDCENYPDEEESEPVAFTAKVIHEVLNLPKTE